MGLPQEPRPRASRRWAALLGLAVAWAAAVPAEEPALPLSDDLRVVVLRGREVALEVRAAPEETHASLARRVAGGADAAAAIEAANVDRPLVPGTWIRVPLALLDDDHRRLALTSLFPDDAADGADWIHVARSGRLPLYDAGLWQVAEWFTGRGDSFGALLEANQLASPELATGQRIRIPAAQLHPAFRLAARSTDGSLEYGTDAAGDYAAYRLRPGEALYSAVVVRFTGRTAAADVVSLAGEIAARSGVRDVGDIPIGYKIKIPLELLEPEFLPADHPRRLEAEATRAEVERERRATASTGRGLGGVVVILDPGHGGRDLGTMNHGIWEHDYVYDVACRLKLLLERETAARVHLTLLDRETGCTASAGDELQANRQGTILTDPPFLAHEEGEARIGVNLRWYLANSIYRRAMRDGVDPARVLFVSLHADARHASLNGVMAYVPGASQSGTTHGYRSKTYQRYSEVREKPIVTFTRRELVRSEALSTSLAQALVRGFRDEGLAVQPYQPVRNRIIRGRSVFVPAVLRGNEVPTKVLVEMVNLAHRGDAELLASAAGRERLARALWRGLERHARGGPA